MNNDELQTDSIRSKYTDKQPHSGLYRLNIIHLYPDLLNLYGDRGNIQCMRMRCKWRGIDANVIECSLDDHPELAVADIVLLGGGSDREQQIVCTRLQKIRRDLRDYVEDGGSLLAICGGYQLLGHYYDTAIMWKTAALCLRSAAAISCSATTTTQPTAEWKGSHWWTSIQSRAHPD